APPAGPRLPPAAVRHRPPAHLTDPSLAVVQDRHTPRTLEKDMHLGRKPKVPFPKYHGRFRLVRTHGRVFAIPPHLPAEALVYSGEFLTHPEVVSAANLQEMQQRLARDAGPGGQVTAAPGAEADGVPVEFAGWLPIYRFSGDCGRHPQFRHT